MMFRGNFFFSDRPQKSESSTKKFFCIGSSAKRGVTHSQSVGQVDRLVKNFTSISHAIDYSQISPSLPLKSLSLESAQKPDVYPYPNHNVSGLWSIGTTSLLQALPFHQFIQCQTWWLFLNADQPPLRCVIMMFNSIYISASHAQLGTFLP